MPYRLAIHILLALIVQLNTSLSNAAESGFTYLFNGKNLEGWTVSIRDQGIVKQQDIFTVSDGMIHAYKNKPEGSSQPFAGLTTNQSYSGHYHFSLEYKWGKTKHAPRDKAVRDAGILFHVRSPEQIWPNSVECQIQEGDTGDIWVIGTRVTSKVHQTVRNYSAKGALITRGGGARRFDRFHRGYSWEVPGWNRVDVMVNQDHAVYKVNGHIVNEAIDMQQWDKNKDKWLPLHSGPIMLQAEGAEVFYRDIKIKEYSE